MHSKRNISWYLVPQAYITSKNVVFEEIQLPYGSRFFMAQVLRAEANFKAFIKTAEKHSDMLSLKTVC